MKQFFLLLLSIMLFNIQVWAAPVNLTQAQSVAQNFTMANGNFYASTVSGGMRLAYAEQSRIIKNQPVFYVFNAGESYVIVAGDDRAESILAYGEGFFDINDIPSGMRYLLNVYKEEIEFLQTHPKYEVEASSQDTQTLMATYVTPLISTKWGQKGPYYNQCPKYNSKRCVTGCVATALSQIMYYWEYPKSAPAMSAYRTYSHNIYVGSLSIMTLNWAKMLKSYSSSATGTSANAVAWLMRYAGQAVSMDYDPNASGATDLAARKAMVNKFGYSSSASLKTRTSSTTNSQWNTWLKNELNAGRPVYYGADDDNGKGGHAFVIDGYNAVGYHINWGWNGSYTGYYALDAFNTNNGYKFNSNQAMIIGLRPNTIVTAPSSKVFSNKTVGRTYTVKFTVKGTYLTGNLTLKLTNETGFFSIDKTTITKSAATNGATVTVTYKPTSAGTHKATITISGGGLTSNKTISLMGNAKKSSGGGNNATTTSLLDETTVSSGDWAWSDMMNNQTTIVKDQDVLNNDQKDLQDKQNNSLPLMSPSNTMTDVNELVTNSKVYTDGQIIVIESPVDQSAIISDISGHSQRVNLQSGHNEIPVNSSGIYIVRIRDKATKLILR